MQAGHDAQDAAPTGEPDAEVTTEQVVADCEDRYKRAVADLDNARKRYARELEHERSAERARTVAALLPVLDNLELALTHADADPRAIIEGVRAVRDQAVEVLAALGYPRFAEVGIPFDPNRHEVVAVVEDAEAPAGAVVQVLRPGYGAGPQLVRPAAVTVAKPRSERDGA